MTSLELNTIVFEHLRKVSPNIASEFKSRHKCFSSSLTLSLTKIDVYKHMLQVTPELAKKFHKKHMANQSLATQKLAGSQKCRPIKIKEKPTIAEQQGNSETIQVITLSKEEIIDVTSDSESSSSESDSDSDIDADLSTLEVNPAKDCEASQVITLSEKEIFNVSSNNESSSSESSDDSDNDADPDILILKEVNQSKVHEANKDTTTSLNDRDEKLFMQALEEQFNCVVTSCSSSSSESDSENNDADIIVIKDVPKKPAAKNIVNKKEPTKKSNLVKRILDKPKPSTIDENMNAVGFILDCPVYSDLKKVLKEDSFKDKIALYILNKNIGITQVNVDHVILCSGQLNQKRHGDAIGVKIGGFTMQEIGIILSNWNTLVTEMNIKNPEETFEMFSNRPKKEDKLKANVLGLYLSQGLPKLRLAADVFHHSEDKILARPSGNISKEEHDNIMDYVSKHGESNQTFKDLAVLLNRGYQSELSIRRYYIKETQQKMLKNGKYTMAENKMFIKGLVSAYNIESVQQIKTLNHGDIILNEKFIELAKNLGRSVFNLATHWVVYIKSLLLQYHAGTVNFDVRRILVNYLLEKEISFLQNISWNELLAFPQFAGHTKPSLTEILNSLIRSTQKKLQCKREEVTMEKVAEYVNDRFNQHKAKPVSRFAAPKMELADYYKSLVEKTNIL